MKPKTATNQAAKFKAAARDLETDNSERRFNEKLGKITRQKPKDAKPKRKAR